MTQPNNDRFQTTHVGSLPRTRRLLETNRRHQEGELGWDEFTSVLHEEVVGVVRRQDELGIDVLNDGEYGHIMTQSVDYGGWWNYSFTRLSGLTPGNADRWQEADEEVVLSEPGRIRLASFSHRRDRTRFKDAYHDPENGVLAGRKPLNQPSITGKIEYIGEDAVAADVAGLRRALDELESPAEGFVAALSPGSAARLPNEFYANDEEVVWACAEALKHEYKAIVDAGFTVQIDDPSIAESWDQVVPEPTVEDYLAFTQVRIDALNHALDGLPEDKVRFHLCWGSWHGPHTTDIEFRHLVKQMLEVRAGSYSFEAANVRHAHEWKVWRDVELPEGKLIVPGLVSHSTNVVEHPELVADRLEQFASVVGREHVIASTDCGLGGRVHPDIAWAKLDSLAEGARLASERLF
ncbi:cobalamin-independent methionine synthase II family protein [Gulosibacter sp. 10]|uniref:cobalamin-independent methionine synthase II family protein n=1 Tax=Gulosibacter sp. 10 TaxID=1255570 RepID=UPI00097EE661|nr:cobalamin-independent methionine synthase II family protein [Gulosibacter sp. 10]SJM57398.1 putative epoxyalkane:coenzyme M transferase [Gulosibacter sp. 10]